jgi:hypothetical protein
VTVSPAEIVKKTTLFLLAVGLAAAINAAAQITPAASGTVPAPANYAPGYTPSAPPLTDLGSTPAAQTHVPESTTLITGCAMLVPLAVSLVRVLRKRHELP